jgi:hypothetical protein
VKVPEGGFQGLPENCLLILLRSGAKPILVCVVSVARRYTRPATPSIQIFVRSSNKRTIVGAIKVPPAGISAWIVKQTLGRRGTSVAGTTEGEGNQNQQVSPSFHNIPGGRRPPSNSATALYGREPGPEPEGLPTSAPSLRVNPMPPRITPKSHSLEPHIG